MSEDVEREAYRRGAKDAAEEAYLRVLKTDCRLLNQAVAPLFREIQEMLWRFRAEIIIGEWPKGGDDANS